MPTASIDSQLLDRRIALSDSPAVQKARQIANDYEGYIALGQALSRQFRYREAIDAYTEALAHHPDDCAAMRLRAGRYLSTLQTDLALSEFQRCMDLGAEAVDFHYRMGLAYYYAGEFTSALEYFAQCFPLCDDEMGIAIMYWHTISARRAGRELSLLKRYRPGRNVGHHTAYEKAMRVWAGLEDLVQACLDAEAESDDMEYSIVMYGLAYHPSVSDSECGNVLENILQRDSFWPCFAFLAAWNDKQIPGGFSLRSDSSIDRSSHL